MPEIKAIETLYNGYRFRSRLEARWAIFFDVLGVEYEYEPEGFLLPSGNKYLPDFRIKCYGTRGGFGETCPFDLYIEVKGRMTQQDADKIHEFASCGYPILVIGNIPNPEEYYHGSEDLKSYDEMDGIANQLHRPEHKQLLELSCLKQVYYRQARHHRLYRR